MGGAKDIGAFSEGDARAFAREVRSTAKRAAWAVLISAVSR